MRKLFLTISLLLTLALSAQTLPFPVNFATKPTVGNASVTIVGQNLENYLVNHLSHNNASCTTQAELEEKTNKIVSAFLYLDADIYAMCELEQSDSSLVYLTRAMNNAAGADIYDYVHDHISDCRYDNTNYGSIMAGFIYKKATVAPVGTDHAMSTENTYIPRMRAQFFREIATGELFLLSMNHFKAMAGAENEAKRLSNARSLVSALAPLASTDPDVLVMGDLNCETSEDAIQYLLSNGFTELTEYFDSRAYSYYYSGNTLIDHALANTSMFGQVTGTGVFHINTSSRRQNTRYHYSDHDPVVVGLALASEHTDLSSAEAIDWFADDSAEADATSSGTTLRIYTITGTYVGCHPEQLASGIYIFRRGATTRKIILP